MIRPILLAFMLLCSMARAQTITHLGGAPLLEGNGAPSMAQGVPNQLYFDAVGHKLWRRTVGGWTQLGQFNSPTDADITAAAAPPSVAATPTPPSAAATPSPAGAPAGPSLLTGAFYMGVNYSGLEGGAVPGTVNFDFLPPSTAHLDYLASRGIKIIRLPVRWERLQPTLNQPLDPTYLGYITTAASYAATKGMGLIVDLHNYGSYGGNLIGSTAVPISAYADAWSRLAASLNNQPGVVGLDLMNEPISLGSVLQPAMQAAVTAIRAHDTVHPILVEGDGYAGAGTWLGYGENASLAISDPANRIIYEAHNYLDCDNSGTHSNWTTQSTDPSQPEAGGTTCNGSQAVTVNIGVQRATVFAQWCQQHGYRCMIGELGAGSDPHWLAALDAELAYLKAKNIGVTYFAAGATFQSYMYGVNPQLAGQQPGDLVDRPAMGVLMKYTGFAAVPYTLYGPRFGFANQPATFNIATNGYIAAPVTITLADNGAGGTFSPPTVTLPVGFGAAATFTYTAPSTGLFRIGATASNAAWINPLAVGYSTVFDLLAQIAGGSGAKPINVLSSTAINTGYAAPVLTLRRGSDGATQSFAYTFGAVDTAAIANWAAGSTLYLHSLADTAPGASSALAPVSGAADEPVWSATALNGHPAYTLANSRLQANSDLSGKTAVTAVATVSIPGGPQCSRLLAWEFTSHWLVPGTNGAWWEDDFDNPVAIGSIDTAAPHVLVMRWQGQGTGTGKRDLFVDGTNVASKPTTAATLPANTGSTGIGSLLYMGWFRFYAPCPTNGTVGDVLVFSGALSDAEVAAITTFEKSQYGLR